MRITATVEVSNRLLPSLNIRNRRPEISYLSVGYVSTKKDNVFILHQTLKNSLGVRYKVNSNILAIYHKFILEGKATISFNEPAVDLIIKGDANKVKHFINIIKATWHHGTSACLKELSNVDAAPTRVVSEPSEKLVIKKRTDFKLSRNLRFLQISHVSLKKFDNRILRLQNLLVLNLEDNEIEEIPAQLDLLPVLQELYLAKNQIGKRSNFSWLRSTTLRSSLSYLDLRENHISFVPYEICRLKNLKSLLLDRNKLKRLPPAIGCLANLKKLTISSNELCWLPGSIIRLNLDFLDTSNNHWQEESSPTGDAQRLCQPLSLVNLAATQVLHQRIDYSEETLPRTLIEFLENAGYCFCHCPSFPDSPDNFRFTRRFFVTACSTEGSREPIIGFTRCIRHR